MSKKQKSQVSSALKYFLPDSRLNLDLLELSISDSLQSFERHWKLVEKFLKTKKFKHFGDVILNFVDNSTLSIDCFEEMFVKNIIKLCFGKHLEKIALDYFESLSEEKKTRLHDSINIIVG